ncbi:hypothetical protein MCUN1_001250 [Malassezia cuniculi]|uniref:TECPR1-like DysF domain-containing protein n=1 Tax=Malassezia cuniculi TaxID=948313 RepID=A0AAF0J6D2_9BASI|nr:hypothetical protein MCUN1_001250 [Malassezia cuniculi]
MTESPVRASVTAENLAKLEGPTSPSKNTNSMRSNATFSQRASANAQSLLFNSVLAIKGDVPRLPTVKRKAPLSVATTSINFRGFVQKSGPLFYFQDNVESTLMWDDWPWTIMWMGIWAVLALHPRLFFSVPPAIVATILCRTYFKKHPLSTDDLDASPGDALRSSLKEPLVPSTGAEQPPIAAKVAHENELQYFYNLRDIQNMMRLIIDGYDDLSPLVPYLNWSSEERSLRILQASLVAAVAMYFIGPLIPVRLVLLLAGEGALVAHHPWVKPMVAALKKQMASSPNAARRELRKRRLNQLVADLIDQDKLPDWAWAAGWKDVELFENQRYVPSFGRADRRWDAANLRSNERGAWSQRSDGWAPVEAGHVSVNDVPYALEPGWMWIDGDDWRIDWGARWSTVGGDSDGFVYTDDAWQRPAPYAYGTDKNAPTTLPDRTLDDEDEDEDASSTVISSDTPEPQITAVTRRRRWLRRAVRIPE